MSIWHHRYIKEQYEMKEKIEYVAVEDLVPYENNARDNDEAVPFLMNSIADHGFRNPILIDGDGVIIAGHTRLKAAKELGMAEVPCIRITDLPPEKVMSLRLADNKVQDYSGWDFDKLDEEFGRIGGAIDMTRFGFDLSPLTLEIKDLDAGPSQASGDANGFEPMCDAFHGGEGSMRVLVCVSCREEAEDLVARLESDGYDAKVLRRSEKNERGMKFWTVFPLSGGNHGQTWRMFIHAEYV